MSLCALWAVAAAIETRFEQRGRPGLASLGNGRPLSNAPKPALGGRPTVKSLNYSLHLLLLSCSQSDHIWGLLFVRQGSKYCTLGNTLSEATKMKHTPLRPNTCHLLSLVRQIWKVGRSAHRITDFQTKRLILFVARILENNMM